MYSNTFNLFYLAIAHSDEYIIDIRPIRITQRWKPALMNIDISKQFFFKYYSMPFE